MHGWRGWGARLAEEYYPAFKAHLVSQGTDLPGYVEQEFEEYLKCYRANAHLPYA